MKPGTEWMERNQLGCTPIKKIVVWSLLFLNLPVCFAISNGFSILNTGLFSSYLQIYDILFKAHYHIVTESLL